MGFSHRTAVVTGAAGNIGYETCRLLGAQGVTVVLADVKAEQAEENAEKLRQMGYGAYAYKMDVMDSADVAATSARILEERGPVDILVNNAGLWPRCRFLDMSEEDWTGCVNLNLLSVFRVTKAFVGGMVERGYGRIINLGSIAGEVGLPVFSAYSASKAGVIMLTKTLAMELAQHGITVNCVSPGMIARGEPKPNAGTWVGRNGTGEEIARVIALLADDDASYITGVDYTVDGGRILGPKNCG